MPIILLHTHQAFHLEYNLVQLALGLLVLFDCFLERCQFVPASAISRVRGSRKSQECDWIVRRFIVVITHAVLALPLVSLLLDTGDLALKVLGLDVDLAESVA